MREGYFKTGKRLQIAIDNMDRIEGLEFYLDCSWLYRNLDMDGFTDEDQLPGHNDLVPIPYWAYEGAIDYGINGTSDYDSDKLVGQLRTGHYEPQDCGDTWEIDGTKYRYISSLPLTEEQEEQASDGRCAYHYRGYAYLRVLEIVTPEVDPIDVLP